MGSIIVKCDQCGKEARWSSTAPCCQRAYRNCVSRESVKRGIRRLKQEVLDHYGRECACCHETIEVFLTIDHIDGDGNRHRREIQQHGGYNFYRWLRRNGWPTGFQVLCINCQWGKQRYGVCPHQQTPPEGALDYQLRAAGAPVSDDRVRLVRALKLEGLTIAAISRQLNMSPHTVGRIIQKKRYAHVK